MKKFNVGDNIIIIHDKDVDYENGFSGISGAIIHGKPPICPQKGEVINTNEGLGVYLIKYVVGDLVMQLSFKESALIKDSEQINQNNNKNMSNLTSMFKNLVRSEPEKTFVKCGIMNESLDLTAEGKELFTNFLFEKNKSEFKTEVADKIVAEQEKK